MKLGKGSNEEEALHKHEIKNVLPQFKIFLKDFGDAFLASHNIIHHEKGVMLEFIECR